MFCVLRFNTQSLPREFELSYQQEMINYIRSFYTTEEDEETVCTILDDDDSRVCHVKSLIKSIAEACIYFSPECESYMNNLEVLVVDDDDDLNAYVTMGSVLVVSSGLLRYYENLQSQGKIANSDEVAVASPLSPAVYCLYFGSRACAHAFQVSLSLSPPPSDIPWNRCFAGPRSRTTSTSRWSPTWSSCLASRASSTAGSVASRSTRRTSRRCIC